MTPENRRFPPFLTPLRHLASSIWRRGLFSLSFLPVFFYASPSSADTVYLKDKSALKGVVVEEHADRYILSTAEGEMPVLKKDVESVSFDDPEQSYYQLGKDLQRAGRLREALEAYRKASQFQPDFQAAREGMFQVERLIWQQEEMEVSDEIEQKRLIMEQAGYSSSDVRSAPTPRQTYENRFGFSVVHEKGWPVVTHVRPKGPGWAAGLQRGDILVSAWGEPLRNLPPDRVLAILNTGEKELSLTIERAVRIQRPENAGFKERPFELEMGYDGMRVSSVIEKGVAHGAISHGDSLVAIGGQPTRYMPLAKALQLIDQESGEIKLTIQRLLVLRKGSDQPSTLY